MADVFQPQSEIDINKKVLDPIVGTNYEVGLKSKFFDGNLLTSLALFKVKQDGNAVLEGHFANGDNYYKPARGVTNKGFELSASGKITDKLNIYTGYTYTTSKDAEGEKIATDIADKAFRLGLDYTATAKLNLGANLKRQSKVYLDTSFRNLPYYMEQPAFSLVNLHASYKATNDLKFQANVINVLNKKYFASPGLWVQHGKPCNFMLRAEYKF